MIATTTQKILLHNTHHNTYRCMCKNILAHKPDEWAVEIQPVHKNLFALYQNVRPDIVFLPVAEYTQEFHDFINEYHQNTSIFLLIDRPVNHGELCRFWKNTNTKMIVDSQHAQQYIDYRHLLFDRLYDHEVFNNQKRPRNDKIAVILSSGSSANEFLHDWLYPQNTQSNLVLFNNPEFKHPQNIGIFNGPDLNVLLNTFAGLIDIDNQFGLEAKACDIPNIDHGRIEHINNITEYPLKETYDSVNLTEASYQYFVQNHLIPFWKTGA